MHLPSRYVVGRELGRGGMGVVYEAEDSRLGRKVAIKVLHGDADNPGRTHRFEQEARAASALNHPNIVTIHDIDAADDGNFIVMELVEGAPLSRLSDGGPLAIEQAEDYAIQIAGALAASHSADIVHRDLKPANVMVTRDGAIKVLDFGLAKRIGKPAAADAATVTAPPQTQPGAILGTSGYMSPEQALGQPADARSDVFSFGVVLYEMLAGRRAFSGTSEWSALNALVHAQPTPLRDLRPDVPAALAHIVERCLEKDPARRYPSAVGLLDDLRRLALALPAGRPSKSPRYLAAAAVVTLAIVIGSTWVMVRRWQSAALVERSLPEIERLVANGQYVDAYRIGMRAAALAPGDQRVRRALGDATQPLNLSAPVGADVYFKDYADVDGPWVLAGRVPIKDERVPQGELRWKFVKAGFDSAEGASPVGPVMTIRPTGEAPAGMVYVRGGPFRLGTVTGQLPDFWLDKYEVTNREFKRFVDAGGYRERKYWKESFEVVDGLRDRTGQPGPATWELGTFPEGQADYPVSGVSWYEAAAYAEFAGKRLPSAFHWNQAIGNVLFGQRVASLANFNGRSAAAVTTLNDLGAYGTYGLSGNVKEWIWNATGDRRNVVGGAWNDPLYMAFNREPRLPLDRNVTHGFRCVRDVTPLPAEALAPIPPRVETRSDKPVGDDLYAAYKALYAYDRGPLDARVETLPETEYWRAELVSIAAAYGHERVPVYLLLPKNAAPPYQAVIWFHGGYAFNLFPLGPDLSVAPSAAYFNFITRGGRALVMPVFQGTFQRYAGVGEFPRGDQVNAYRDMVVQWSKDMGRTIDYLETRPDFDAGKVGFYGLSAGATAALPIVAVEPRLKAVVLLSGGLQTTRRPPETDPINFAPRIIAPTLMLNGRDDFVFPLDDVARPLFALLGAPSDRKRLAIHEGGHLPPLNELIRDVLGWFDQYLGPVATR
jgi:formylglycine-generating enzyme required for sulfatase activity/dienelactone hydrolase/predicted Ser/Thr protein kinase